MKKIITLALAAIMIIGMMVPALASENNEEDLLNETFPEYVNKFGNIEKINLDENLLILKDQEITTHLMVEEYTRIFNTKGEEITINDLKDGQSLAYYIKSNLPIPAIDPARFAAEIIIAYDDNDSSLEFGRFKDMAIDDRLIINSLENTEIISESGEKLEKKDLEDRLVLVIYKMATRSIPPQTSPEKIIVLDTFLAELVNSYVKVNNKDIIIKDGNEYLPLRKVFEENGYEVKWNPESEYIELIDDDMITLINSKEKYIDYHDEKIGLDMYIENGKTFIKL